MKKIAILSNVNLSFVNQNLKDKFEIFIEEGFNQWASLFTSPESSLKGFHPEVVFLIFDFNFSDVFNDLSFINTFSYIFDIIKNFVKSNENITFFINNLIFSPYDVKVNDDLNDNYKYAIEWNKHITNLLKLPSVHLFDLENLFFINHYDVFSKKLMQLASIPFSVKFCKAISEKISFLISRIGFVRKKVLCLDLDNTLWGGVLGDVGPLGVKIGSKEEGYYYRYFQTQILKIKETGTLLCIVSKNEFSNVEEVFNKNPNLVLKKNDFTIIKANWNPKSQNILEISQELNLGLDSFVFIDDNKFELNEVKSQFPLVETISFEKPEELLNLPSKIYNEYFHAFKLTNEDRNKTNQYESIKKRDQFRNSINNFESFLLSLEMKIIVNRMKKDNFERVFQLINKTNQFNLTTTRYSLDDFNHLVTDKNKYIFVSNVEDKFSNEGLVFVLIGNLIEKNFYIENIVMSCRVMGRNIEYSIFELIENYLFKIGVRSLHGKYISSNKNKPVKDLYNKLGFVIIETNENSKLYRKDFNNNFVKAIIKASWKNED